MRRVVLNPAQPSNPAAAALAVALLLAAPLACAGTVFLPAESGHDAAPAAASAVRQLRHLDSYAGTYTTTVSLVTSHCSNSADNGERTGSYVVGIEQNGSDMTITAGFAKHGTSVCTYYGTFWQSGRDGELGSSYTCSDGDEGAMGFFKLGKARGMFSGSLQGHSISDSCDYSGTMTGRAVN